MERYPRGAANEMYMREMELRGRGPMEAGPGNARRGEIPFPARGPERGLNGDYGHEGGRMMDPHRGMGPGPQREGPYPGDSYGRGGPQREGPYPGDPYGRTRAPNMMAPGGPQREGPYPGQGDPYGRGGPQREGPYGDPYGRGGPQREGPYPGHGDPYGRGHPSDMRPPGGAPRDGPYPGHGDPYGRPGPPREGPYPGRGDPYGRPSPSEMMRRQGEFDGPPRREPGPGMQQEPGGPYHPMQGPRARSRSPRTRSPFPSMARPAYPDEPRERAPDPAREFPPRPRDYTSHPGMSSREGASYPDPARYPASAREFPERPSELVSYPDLYRERSLYPPKHAGDLPPSSRDPALSSSMYDRGRSPVRGAYVRPLSPLSPLPPYRRSRSPLGPRDPYLRDSDLLDRRRSPYPGRARSLSPPLAPARLRSLSPEAALIALYKKRPRSSEKSLPPKGSQSEPGSAIRVDGFPPLYEVENIRSLLSESFIKYGTVTEVQVHKHTEGHYGLVFFAQRDASDLAVRESKKKEIFNTVLSVSPWVIMAGDKDRPVTLASTRVMYVENLDPTVGVEELQKIFGRHGDILDIEIKKVEGSFCNSAIVQFWSVKHAKAAARALDLHKIGKCLIRTVSGKNKVSSCVWVDGFAKDVDERKLLKPFEKCGHVEKHVIDRKRGAALILFKAHLPARQCVRSMENGKTTVGDKCIQVDYANERAQAAFCHSMEKSGQDMGSFLFV